MEDLPDPDNCFTFFHEEEDNYRKSNQEVRKDACSSCCKGIVEEQEPQYMLGTLIVRVVAAKGLTNPNSRGDVSFGGVFRSSSSTATINPYASVKFGNSTQRGSEVRNSSDPVFPRNEIMFMDVSLPLSKLTHDFNTNHEIDDAVPNSSELERKKHRNANANANTSVSNTSIDFHSGSHFLTDTNNTTLTIALFHSPTEVGGNINRSKQKIEGKLSGHGDSDDAFLGMASVDLSPILTGQRSEFDEWLPLHGTVFDTDINTDYRSSKGASVRITCEYELNDIPPKRGDVCRFNRFCHPKDLYPLEAGKSYRVEEVHNNGEVVILNYESPEGWVLCFSVNKRMLIIEERRVSALNTAQDELQTLGERLSVSPMMITVTENLSRVKDDGLIGVAEGIVKGGFSTFDRWFKGGIDVDTIIGDIQDGLNLDGRHNQDFIEQRFSSEYDSRSLSSSFTETDNNAPYTTIDNDLSKDKKVSTKALPNMPPCPITGFPMAEPVVLADGHTYERNAISRWLQTSDKSPMTGSVLSHKELVPNYGLMSNVEGAATQIEKYASPPAIDEEE